MGSPIRYSRLPGGELLPASVVRQLAGSGFAQEDQERETARFCIAVIRTATPTILADVLRQSGRTSVLVVLSSPSQISNDTHWELLAAGALDIIDGCEEATLAERIAIRLRHWEDIERLAESEALTDTLAGNSSGWRMLKRKLVEAAVYSAGNILLVGETGTGKEQLARAIHALDRRPAKRELAIVDCTTLSPELLGSEMFGHERGAFTGAANARDGAFALANGGTLLLDEIGELPLPLQAQLLRVIQERTYKRVGGNVWHRTDFRLVCATNRHLEQAVKKGGFRADLYHRIADWVLRPPSLRDRRDDVLPLARHFLRPCGSEPADFDGPLADYLLCREYPGNVRELRGLVMRLRSRHVGGGPITLGALPLDERPRQPPAEPFSDPGFLVAIRRALDRGHGLKEIGRAVAETAIRMSLEQEQGNLRRAALRLRVTDRALQLRRAGSVGAAAGLSGSGHGPSSAGEP